MPAGAFASSSRRRFGTLASRSSLVAYPSKYCSLVSRMYTSYRPDGPLLDRSRSIVEFSLLPFPEEFPRSRWTWPRPSSNWSRAALTLLSISADDTCCIRNAPRITTTIPEMNRVEVTTRTWIERRQRVNAWRTAPRRSRRRVPRIRRANRPALLKETFMRSPRGDARYRAGGRSDGRTNGGSSSCHRRDRAGGESNRRWVRRAPQAGPAL
ncbi:hypothetical protein BJF79_07655 [Actinomadura sp. CNU-125]|nr:hypothetical protein BJF79_07655 [Actinomadura sp. CNU-125]